MASEQPTQRDLFDQPQLPPLPSTDDMKAYKRAWRARRKASGVCTTCGGVRDVLGGVRCQACLDKDNADYQRIGKARYQRRAGEVNGKAKADRERWKAEGRCTWCGGERDVAGQLRCAECNAYNRTKLREQAECRRASGNCPKCGKKPERGVCCDACRTTGVVEYRRLMAKRAAEGWPPCPPTLVCYGCGEAKPAAAFARNARNVTGRHTQCKACCRAFYLDNRDRIRAAVRAERKAFGNEVRAKQRATRKHMLAKMTPEERIAWKEKQRNRSARQREGDRVKFRLQCQKAMIKWRRTHPDEAKAKDHAARVRRQQRLLVNGGNFTAAEWRTLKAVNDFRCLACKRKEPEIVLTPDHIKPVCKGGSNGIENIQPLCLPCNLSKATKDTDYRG